MHPLLWCVIGALAGWLATLAMPAAGLVNRIENMLVGVFGAFTGGEFLASFVAAADPAGGLRNSALMLAVGAAAAMLLVLAWMRKTVGPMRQHKRKKVRI